MILAKIRAKTKINKSKTWQRLMVVTLAFFVLIMPIIASARTFNPDDIISDTDLFDKDALSTAAIQKFLERENSVLARFSQVVEGQTLKASEMIWKVGQKWNVNPKFILTNLEKEQALISKTQATEKALDWATGYGCYGGTCKEKYRGFYNQIDATAETQHIYKQRANEFGFRIGITTKSFDGYNVTPQNQATANLYIYTPYVGNAPELGVSLAFGGNKLFWRVWNRYFASQKFVDDQIITDGINYWLIKDGKKLKFANQNIFAADYKLTEAIFVSGKDLDAYPNGPIIHYPDNTLVKSSASGQVFLIDDQKKRAIVDDLALSLLSDFNIAITGSEVTTVPDSNLEAYTFGDVIISASVFPQGKLFKDETGTIWQVKNGIKSKVDPLIWQNRFNSKTPQTVTTAALAGYPDSEPLKLKDGTFVNNDGKYYLISNGERMRIQSLDVFDRVFGTDKKNNALNVSDAVLNLHDAGEMIDYIDDTIKDPVTPTQPVTTVTGNYAANFASMEPESLLLISGAQVKLTANFTNLGSTAWQPGDVWLRVTDQGKDTSLFGVDEKINFSETNVTKNQTASFTFTITAPTDQSGLLNQEFNLYYNKNGTPTKLFSIGKFLVVRPGIAAQVIENNLPVAVKNNWQPLDITMKIKNVSPDTTWLSRRTALEVYNKDGSPSNFYDPNDWVRREVAAVPVNQSTIAPGQTGEFKFTIDPRGLKPGIYLVRFNLRLLDKEKNVYLDGRLDWDRLIRVD